MNVEALRGKKKKDVLEREAETEIKLKLVLHLKKKRVGYLNLFLSLFWCYPPPVFKNIGSFLFFTFIFVYWLIFFFSSLFDHDFIFCTENYITKSNSLSPYRRYNIKQNPQCVPLYFFFFFSPGKILLVFTKWNSKILSSQSSPNWSAILSCLLTRALRREAF